MSGAECDRMYYQRIADIGAVPHGRFIVEAELSRDESGHEPLPRRIGPFSTEGHACEWLAKQGPLYGSWGIVPVTPPAEARAEARGAGMSDPMSDERLAEIDRMPLYTKDEIVWQALEDLYDEVIRQRSVLARVKAVLDEPYDDEWDEANQAQRARDIVSPDEQA